MGILGKGCVRAISTLLRPVLLALSQPQRLQTLI
jgi:hypothetical protein